MAPYQEEDTTPLVNKLPDLEDVSSESDGAEYTPVPGVRVPRVLAVLLAAGCVVAMAFGAFKALAPTSQLEEAKPEDAVKLVGSPCDVAPVAPVAPVLAPASPCAVAPVVAPVVPPPAAPPPSPQGASPNQLHVLQNALHKAAKVEADGVRDAGGRLLTEDTVPVAGAVKALDAALAKGTIDVAQKAIADNHAAIEEAIEILSESEEAEVAAQNGELVTLQVIDLMNNRTETPEMAPQSLSQDFQGDIGQSEEPGNPRRLGADGRRLWAATVWANAGDIPYCFDPNIAASSKTAFLHAIQQVSNIVPCLQFRWVGVKNKGKGWCSEVGIYVQSSDSGCYAYLGQPSMCLSASWGCTVGDQWDQSRLNLEPNACDTLGIAVHELGHSLGMAHEQARPDWSDHVVILWNNIQANYIDQYEVSPNADQSVPYDIMSIMHYSDTSFGINGATTMTAIGQPRGLMGNRMGLSQYDALQLSRMYTCSYNKKPLCTNDPTKCTYDECICHQNPSGTSAVIKTIEQTSGGSCKRCMRKCPDNGYCNKDCGCGSGFAKQLCHGISSPGTWYTCRVSPSPPPTPAPTPPPTPALPCAFPTNPSGCAAKDMPGCTTCDGDNSWCYTTAGNNDWRYCKAEDNACTFPMVYNDKTYNKCTKDGNAEGKYWCKKYGGGWRYCDSSMGHTPPAPPPTPPPPPPTPAPTPAPPPPGCVFPFDHGGHTYNGCMRHTDEKDYCWTGNAWKYCTTDENLCYFPVTFGWRKYRECVPWGLSSWCYLAGAEGGWKYC